MHQNTSRPTPDCRPPTTGENRSRPTRDSRLATRHLVPYVVLALCCLVLFRDGLFGERVFYERDTYLFYAPLGRWYAEQLKHGSLPLWMPLIFGGYPLFADGEMGMLYPLNLLLLPLLSPTASLTALRALHVFLAGSFMLAFLRTLGLRPWGGLVGALVFAFGSFFVTQIQHENLVRSAAWLPLILLLVELALRRRGWARQRLLVGAGLVFAVAALGVHIQPIAMILLALGLFVAYRLLVGPVAGLSWERALLLIWAPGLVTAIGLAGAAVQWLPLYELGRTSYRGPGLGYDLATTWPLRWQNLVTVLFPYLFRLEDGRNVMLWQQWESFLYVGMAPLVLIPLGLLFGRHRLIPFFILLGLFGLAVGLADQSPFINVHLLLWNLPGFSSLRAPGRFAYLVVLAAGGLAAFGADWLVALRRRSWLGAAVGLLTVLSCGALSWLVVALHTRLVADPVRWLQIVDDSYIAVPHEHSWLKGPLVYDQLVRALDLSEPKTALSLGLLLAAGLLAVGWCLRPRPTSLWATLLVTLVAGDLLVFGYDFHPLAPLSELVEPAPLTRFLATQDGGRVVADPALRYLEPNRLLYADVPTVDGYSSLQSQRHYEYATSVERQQDVLLDLWGVRYVVVPDPPTDIMIVDGTAYRPYNALFNGAAYNRTGLEAFAIEPFRTVEVRVLATLIDGIQAEQGTPTAELELMDGDGGRRAVALRAGEHVAENAYDRADVLPVVRHSKAPSAGTVPDIDPAGLPTRTSVYRAAIPIEPLDVSWLEVRQLYPRGQTRIFGIGLVGPDGSVRSIFGADRAKLRPIYQGAQATVLEDQAAFPRAYIVPEAIARRSRAEQSALPRLAARPFDAGRQVILEEGPFDGLPLVEPQPGSTPRPDVIPPAAEVTDLSTDHVRVRTPDGPGGYLVLTDTYHRGWQARLDDVETPVYLANFLFRAVRLPPGPHTVDFVFDPLSFRLGRAISADSLGFCAIVLSFSLARSRRSGRQPRVR
ncbi:MAG TPA: hypothetical protein VEQ11_08455 [Chloroflexota bacterium]|nr:hypothetical protein [Chloroflexota bacterium]